MTRSSAVAQAHPNIALAKYWGKLDAPGNLPAVPSLSLTLAGMVTTTRVTFESSLPQDVLLLNDAPASRRDTDRVGHLLDHIWPSDKRPRAEVVSTNDFPTAAGLASSASAFAALAVAANRAAGAGRSEAELSDLARRSSASAARSLFGGFVELPAGRTDEADAPAPAASLAAPEHWDLRLVIAVTTTGRKPVGSTEGMNHTAGTSPLYRAWLDAAPGIFARVRRAVMARDFEALGRAAEHSALTMHATAIAAEPGLIYWTGSTVEALAEVRRMRADGLGVYFTVDAGPHVKAITTPAEVAEVKRRLARVPGVQRTIITRPGPGAQLVESRPASEGGG